MHTRTITMVIRSLMGGGAEKVMTLMANYWVAHGCNVHIITTTPVSTDAYPLDARVNRIILSTHGTRTFPWPLMKLRKAILATKADTVISFMDRTSVPTVLACCGLPAKVIVSEHIDPIAQPTSFFRSLAVKVVYNLADAVTVLTENVKQDWAKKFILTDKVHCIANPVDPFVPDAPLPDWVPSKYFCCVGRLHIQKGYDRLFAVLPEIFTAYPEYHLIVLGEGPERCALEAQLDELGIRDRVHMPGFIPAPQSIIKNAKLCFLPSRFEGYPMSLIEAMGLGVPVVAFDCPSGPRYIIQDKVNGCLIPRDDISKFCESIHWLMQHDQATATIAQNAKEILKTNAVDKIMQQWESLIARLG